MLERLRITDFQKHQRLDLEFDPRVTTIAGASDVGKSAVVRSLRWLFTNRPRGDAFLRHGSERTEVKLLVDGQTVARTRGKGENGYRLGKQRYEAFATDVPPQVSCLLNVGEANTQLQHDGPYWFNKTPGEVAKELNRIVDLEVIDAVVERLAKRQRSLKAEADVVEKRLAAAKEEQEGLSYVPKMNESLMRLERLGGELETVESGLSQLEDLLEGLADRRRELSRLRGRAGVAASHIERLEKTKAEWSEKSGQLEGLSRLLEGIDGDRKRAAVSARKAAEAYNRLKKEMGDKCPLCGREVKGEIV